MTWPVQWDPQRPRCCHQHIMRTMWGKQPVRVEGRMGSGGESSQCVWKEGWAQNNHQSSASSASWRHSVVPMRVLLELGVKLSWQRARLCGQGAT